MEIIAELEPVKRGVYSGAVGYLSWHGNMDTAIAIRTAVIQNGQLHIQAGAGVVADSQPDLEWQETMSKGRAVFRAVALAEAGLDSAISSAQETTRDGTSTRRSASKLNLSRHDPPPPHSRSSSMAAMSLNS